MDGDLNQTGDESPPICFVPLCSTKLRSDGESGKSRTTDGPTVVTTTTVRQTQTNEAATTSESQDAGVFTFSPPELRRTGNEDTGVIGVLTGDGGSTSRPMVSVCLPLQNLVASPSIIQPAHAVITHATSRETIRCTADDLPPSPKMAPTDSTVFGVQDSDSGQEKTGNKAESRIFSNHDCEGKEGKTEDGDQVTSSASLAPTVKHVGILPPRSVTRAGEQSSLREPQPWVAAASPVKTEQQWQQATEQVVANTKTAVAPPIAGVTLPDVLVADHIESGSDEEDEDELPLMVDLGSTPEYTAAAGGSAAATATIETSSEVDSVEVKTTVCSTSNADPEGGVTVIGDGQFSVNSNQTNALPSATESSVSIHATPVSKVSWEPETGDSVTGSGQALLPGPPGVAYAAAGACATPPLVVIASPVSGGVKDMTGRAMLTTAIAVGAVTSQPAASCAPPVGVCQTRSGRPINASSGASVTTSAGGGSLLCGGFSRQLRPLAPAIGGFSSASSSGASPTVTPTVMSTTTAQPAVQLLSSAYIAAGSLSSAAVGGTSLTPLCPLAPAGQPVALSGGSSLATPLAPSTLQLFNMAPAVTATPLPQFIGGPSILFHTTSTASPTAFPMAANPSGGAPFAGQPLGSFLSTPAPTLQPHSSLTPTFLGPATATTLGSTFVDSSSLYPTFFHPPASSPCFLVASSASASSINSSSSNTVSYSVSAGATSAALSGKVCSTGVPSSTGLFWPPISLSGSSALNPLSSPTLMPSCIFPPFSLPFPTPDCCLQSHSCLPGLMTTTNTHTVAAGCYQPANFRIASEPDPPNAINNSIASTVGTADPLSCSSSTAPPTPLVLTPANNALCHPGGACTFWSAATGGAAASVALQCSGPSGSSTGLLTAKPVTCVGGCPFPPVASLEVSLPQPPVLQPCPLISPCKPPTGVYTAGIPPLVARPPPPPPAPLLVPLATASIHLGVTATTAAGGGGIRAPNSTVVMPALRRRRPIARSAPKLLSLVNGVAGNEAAVAISSKVPVQPTVDTSTVATTVPASSVCDSQTASLSSVSSVGTTTAVDAGSLQSNASSGNSHCQPPSAANCSSIRSSRSSTPSSCAPVSTSSPADPVVVVVEESISGSPVALSSSSCKWPCSSTSSVMTTDSSCRPTQSSGQKDAAFDSSQGHLAWSPLNNSQTGAVRFSGDWSSRDQGEAVEKPVGKGTGHVPTTSWSSPPPPPSSSLPTGFSPASSSPAETSVDSNLSSSSSTSCTSSGSSSSISSSSFSGSSSSPVAVPGDLSKEERERLGAAAQGKRSTTSAVHRRHLRRDETGRAGQQTGGRAALSCSSGTLMRGYPQSPGAGTGSNGRRILTHFIDGHVIYESNQPFPVKNGMAVVEAALLVQCIKEKEEEQAALEEVVPVVVVPQPPHRHWHQPVTGRGGHARKSTSIGSRTAATIDSRQQAERQSPEAFSSSSSCLVNGKGDHSPPSRHANSCQATAAAATTKGRGGISATGGSEVVKQSAVVESTTLSSPCAQGERSQAPLGLTTPKTGGGGAAPETIPRCLNGSSQQAHHLPAPTKAIQAVRSKSPPPARPGPGANRRVDTNPSASQGPVASIGCFTSCAAHHHQQSQQPPVHSNSSSTYQQSTGIASPTPTMPCAGLPPGPVRQWSTQDVVAFVMSIPGCGAYAPAFLANEVDGEALLYLTEDQFIQPPISMKIGPALKLAARLETLLRQA